MTSYRSWIVYSTLLLGIVGSAASQDRAERLEFVTKRFVDAVNDQDYLAARQDFSQAMLNALLAERSKQLYSGLVDYYGKIEGLSSPRLTSAGQGVFVAHCTLRDLEICVNLDEHGMIAGLSFRAADMIRESDKAKTSFRLPFQGQWLVAGSSQHSTRNERFAVDFHAVDETGQLYRGNGKVNEDYFAFGMPVLAPADGVVTDVVTGVRDNMPGSANPSCAPGNMIILEHREHEVSVMCHLQLDSIKVKRGDEVKQGQMIALCANSGCSLRPHLPFHVQNTPIFHDAVGLHYEFEQIAVNGNGHGESKTRYVPVNGDIVRQTLDYPKMDANHQPD